MNTTTKIALAVAGGYLLGRRRKAKMAILLTSVLVGKRLDLRALGKEAMERFSDVPGVGQIRDDVRGGLASTGRTAAGAAISAPLNKLADRLHERTEALSGGGPDGQERDRSDEPSDEAAERGSEDEDQDEREDERQDDRAERDRDEPREEERPRRRRAPSRPRGGGEEPVRRSRPRTGQRRSPAGAAGRRSRS